MYLLDTDTVSLFLYHRTQYPQLERRILSVRWELLYVSVVTAEEMIQGAFNVIRQEQQRRKGTIGYKLLKDVVEDLRPFQLLAFDDACQSIFASFPSEVRRLGRGDCQIAATALNHKFTVVTRNEIHFGKIPNIRFENWTPPFVP